MARKTRKPKQVTALTHGEASRKNLPTEHQALAEDDRAGAGDLRAAQSRRQADYEVLYDIRVAGPFTVESLSPHRTLPMDEDDEAEASEVRTNALRNKWATAIRISRR